MSMQQRLKGNFRLVAPNPGPHSLGEASQRFSSPAQTLFHIPSSSPKGYPSLARDLLLLPARDVWIFFWSCLFFFSTQSCLISPGQGRGIRYWPSTVHGFCGLHTQKTNQNCTQGHTFSAKAWDGSKNLLGLISHTSSLKFVQKEAVSLHLNTLEGFLHLFCRTAWFTPFSFSVTH